MKHHHDPRQELAEINQKIRMAEQIKEDPLRPALHRAWAYKDLEVLRESKRQLEAIIGAEQGRASA